MCCPKFMASFKPRSNRRLLRRKSIRKRVFRIFIAMAISLLVFGCILWAFSYFWGWPYSYISLTITLGTAFFVGSLCGSVISRTRLITFAPAALALGLATGSVLVGIPWEWARVGIWGTQVQENVMVKVEATFTLLATEDNGPLENVAIWFPLPHIDNKVPSDKHGPLIFTTWQLEWVSDNTLEIQQRETEVVRFYGQRVEPLRVLDSGYSLLDRIPRAGFLVDKLYPGESFRMVELTPVPLNDKDKVSLKVPSKENSDAAIYYISGRNLLEKAGPFSKSFDGTLWAYLSVQQGDKPFELREKFFRSFENSRWGLFFLVPHRLLS